MGLNTYLDLKSVSKNIARILICYDALLQLRQKKVRAEKGRYVVVRKSNDEYSPICSLANKSKQQIDSVLDKQYCQACALGTLFISRARIFNKIKVGDIPDFQSGEITYAERQGSTALYNDLLEYFDSDQLSLIEACFEGEPIGIAGLNSRDNSEIDEISEKFLYKYKTPESRLIAILKNIISNDGIFIPLKNLTKKRKKVDKSKIVVKEIKGENS